MSTEISPQGYVYGFEPTSANPFWKKVEPDPVTKAEITATASVSQTTGTPDVEVTRTETVQEDTEIINFDFAFSGLKGAQGEPGQPGPAGEGVPAGGTAGQVLKKYSDSDYQTHWGDVIEVPTGGSIGQVLTKYGAGNGQCNWQDAAKGGTSGIGEMNKFLLNFSDTQARDSGGNLFDGFFDSGKTTGLKSCSYTTTNQIDQTELTTDKCNWVELVASVDGGDLGVVTDLPPYKPEWINPDNLRKFELYSVNFNVATQIGVLVGNLVLSLVRNGPQETDMGLNAAISAQVLSNSGTTGIGYPVRFMLMTLK